MGYEPVAIFPHNKSVFQIEKVFKNLENAKQNFPTGFSFLEEEIENPKSISKNLEWFFEFDPYKNEEGHLIYRDLVPTTFLWGNILKFSDLKNYRLMLGNNNLMIKYIKPNFIVCYFHVRVQFMCLELKCQKAILDWCKFLFDILALNQPYILTSDKSSIYHKILKDEISYRRVYEEIARLDKQKFHQKDLYFRPDEHLYDIEGYVLSNEFGRFPPCQTFM